MENEILAVIEYNDAGCLIYAQNYPGAFVRGATQAEALAKFDGEIRSYLHWATGEKPSYAQEFPVTIVQEKKSELQVCDADSDVLFASECGPMTREEYDSLRYLVLKSAQDFQCLYSSVPNPDISLHAPRKTFYGLVPRTPREMYEHTNSVTNYYCGEIDVAIPNLKNIVHNRMHALSELEGVEGFLDNAVHEGSFDESWTLKKVLRRFIWHDRIHAKAMYRTAVALWGKVIIENPFCFEL